MGWLKRMPCWTWWFAVACLMVTVPFLGYASHANTRCEKLFAANSPKFSHHCHVETHYRSNISGFGWLWQ